MMRLVSALLFVLTLIGCDLPGNTLNDFDGDRSLDEVDCGPADDTVYRTPITAPKIPMTCRTGIVSTATPR